MDVVPFAVTLPRFVEQAGDQAHSGAQPGGCRIRRGFVALDFEPWPAGAQAGSGGFKQFGQPQLENAVEMAVALSRNRCLPTPAGFSTAEETPAGALGANTGDFGP